MNENEIIDVDYEEVGSETSVEENMATPSQVHSETYENLNYLLDPSDKVTYEKYRLDEVDKYTENLPSLNYIELTNMRDQTKAQRSQMEQLKGLIESIDKMELPDGTNRSVVKANLMRQVGAEDAETKAFMDNYDVNFNQMTYLIQKIEKELGDRYDGIRETSTFFTEQMIEVLQKRINALDPSQTNYNFLKKRYETSLDAFNNRLDDSYISHYAFTTVNNKRIMKKYRQSLDGAANLAPFMTDLRKVYNQEQIDKIATFFTEECGATPEVLSIIFFIFARITKNEIESGKDNYLRAYFLNILDYLSGGFDLCEITEDNNIIRDHGKKLVAMIGGTDTE